MMQQGLCEGCGHWVGQRRFNRDGKKVRVVVRGKLTYVPNTAYHLMPHASSTWKRKLSVYAMLCPGCRKTARRMVHG